MIPHKEKEKERLGKTTKRTGVVHPLRQPECDGNDRPVPSYIISRYLFCFKGIGASGLQE